jgi:hypothetical protein
MKRLVRKLAVVTLSVVLAGCGDGSSDTVIIENDNGNGVPTPILTPTSGPTPIRTATLTATPTEIPPTETPAAEETETPIPEVTETPLPGATFTPGGGPTKTPTPKPTKTVTPSPQATASGPFCGNGVKDAGEQCDTGTTFGASSADCATQCACCLCRPDFHDVPGPKCATCHPSIGPPLTFPAGAATTFPGLCE